LNELTYFSFCHSKIDIRSNAARGEILAKTEEENIAVEARPEMSSGDKESSSLHNRPGLL
jgi:hypothetical protein